MQISSSPNTPFPSKVQKMVVKGSTVHSRITSSKIGRRICALVATAWSHLGRGGIFIGLIKRRRGNMVIRRWTKEDKKSILHKLSHGRSFYGCYFNWISFFFVGVRSDACASVLTSMHIPRMVHKHRVMLISPGSIRGGYMREWMRGVLIDPSNFYSFEEPFYSTNFYFILGHNRRWIK